MSTIDDILHAAVADGAVPNAVAIVANREGVLYRGSAGVVSPTDDTPVDANTVYRIMSMTKIITTTVALQLVEKGALDLDAPVAQYYPDFAKRKILTGFDGDTPQFADPTRQATVKQLITHTAGQGYMFFNSDLHKWEDVTGYPGILCGKPEMLDSPLLFEPGERFEYGINTDVLGAVVEAAAGERLDAMIQAGVLDPLGMSDTSYVLEEGMRSRVTPIQVKDEHGQWVANDIDYAQDPELIPGGHGLYSTANDYIKFQRALLGGGALGGAGAGAGGAGEGARLLEESTVQQMFSNQIGDLWFPEAISTGDPFFSDDYNAGPGWKWGLGLLVNTEDVPGMRKAGSGAWAGLCNTQFWIDPTSGLAGSIYSQTLPFVSPGAVKMYQDFEKAVYAEFG